MSVPRRFLPRPSLPPAIKHHRGQALSSDPEQPKGVAVFRHDGKITLVTWETPFLQGTVYSVSEATFRDLLGLKA